MGWKLCSCWYLHSTLSLQSWFLFWKPAAPSHFISPTSSQVYSKVAAASLWSYSSQEHPSPTLSFIVHQNTKKPQQLLVVNWLSCCRSLASTRVFVKWARGSERRGGKQELLSGGILLHFGSQFHETALWMDVGAQTVENYLLFST